MKENVGMNNITLQEKHEKLHIKVYITYLLIIIGGGVGGVGGAGGDGGLAERPAACVRSSLHPLHPHASSRCSISPLN